MRKLNTVDTLWLILIFFTIVSVGYHMAMRTTKSLLFVSGIISLFMLLRTYDAYVTKRIFGRGKDVVKKKNPKTFKAYIVVYAIIFLLGLIAFVHSAIVLMK